jgi:hypothetical protein
MDKISLALIACVVLAWSSQAFAAEPSGQIALIPGLTATSAVSARTGDYETLAVIKSVTSSAYKLTLSGEAPDDSGTVREITVRLRTSVR